MGVITLFGNSHSKP
ncbi:hypothetical protein LINGRAHAP2_LOCUS35215 [Linum grandiflorum]